MIACTLLMFGSATFLAAGSIHSQGLAILPDGLLDMRRLTAAVILFISTGAALIFNLQSQRVFAIQNSFNAAPMMELHLLACCIAILSGNLLLIASAWIFISASHHLQTSYPDGQSLAPLVAWRRWLISIIGDCGFLLVAALPVTAYKSTDIHTIYDRMMMNPDPLYTRHLLGLIAPLLIIVIFIKCAQFPFSYWLAPSRRDNTSWLNLQLSCGSPLVAILVLLRLEPMLRYTGSSPHVVPVMVNWAALSGGIYGFAGIWQTDRFKAAFFMAVSSISFLLVLIGSGEMMTAEWGIMILFPSIFLLLFGLMLSAPLNRRPFFPSRRPGYRSALACGLIVCGCINLCMTPGFSASLTLGSTFAAVARDHLASGLPDMCLLWLTIVFNTMTGVGLLAWSVRGRPPIPNRDLRPITESLPPPKPSIVSTGLLLMIGGLVLFSGLMDLLPVDGLGRLLPRDFAIKSIGGPASMSNPAISMAIGGSALVAGLILGSFIQLAGKAAVRGRLAKVVLVRQTVLLLLTIEQFTAGSVVALIWAAGKLIAGLDRFGLDMVGSTIGLMPHLIATCVRRGIRCRGPVRMILLAFLFALSIAAAGIAAAIHRAGGI
ncbi:MAG: hypothetical protein ACP5O1_09090 [Phycisphaerae bacterium]